MVLRTLVRAAPLLLALTACGIPVTRGPAQNGALCDDGQMCASGVCVDGVCCESECRGACVSCAVEGSAGKCVNTPDGEDLRGQCGDGVCGGACDGQGACRYPGAEVTCGEKVCSGDAVLTAACDGAGNCGTSALPCAPYACEDAACLTSCADPLDCARTGKCNPDGTCEAKLPPGSACASGAACASGYCADGVCCDKPCQGTCEACNLASSMGTCTLVPAGEDPDVECPGGAPCGSSCDGQGACAWAAAGTSCGPGACSAPDAPVLLQQCNGAGTCVTASAGCGEYACLGNACKVSCGTDADCRSTAYCAGASCVPRKALGEACAGPEHCLSGFCVDGVCCSSACGDACDACGGATPGLCSPAGAGAIPQISCGLGQTCGQSAACPTTCSATSPCALGYYCDAGTCRQVKATGQACAADRECGSGFCDDGVCCASDCTNTPCKACNTTAQATGQCLPLPWGTSGTCAGNYACLADGQCGSGACADDRDCTTSAFCAGASGCSAQKANGQTCGRGRECQSGNCVDGVCCATACAGECRACNLTAALGSCSLIVGGADPFAECVGGLACNGAGACNVGCTSNAQCERGFVCQMGACVAGKTLGQACAGGAECASGFCADGVCCNNACTGTCKACNQSAQKGTCSNVPADTDPAPASCPGGYTCNGSGACQTTCSTNADCKSGYGCKSGQCVLLKPNGDTCAAGADCQSGFCTDGVCCNGACSQTCEACNVGTSLGACVAFPAGTDPQAECGVNTCNGLSACGATCTSDLNCASGSFCNNGACAPKQPNGQVCGGNNHCQSGFCVDGVCCDGACTGECRSCSLTGSVGTCTLIAAGVDPFAECAGGLACNGAGACYSSCAGPGNCEAAYYCSGGVCAPDLALGQSCSAADQCQSGNCVDGVCCNSACSGVCSACNQSGAAGTCTPYQARTDPQSECNRTFCDGSAACISPCAGDTDCKSGNYCDATLSPASCQPKRPLGQTCTAGNQCQSGMCVDGVCCDGACTGGCEACDLSGTQGTCTSVPNRQDPDNECGLTYCSGAKMCINPCVVDADCKSGNVCLAGTCTPKKANGSTCVLAVECQSGFCADGVCCNSACGGSCDVCNVTPGTCTLLAQGSPGSPSCSPYECTGSSATCPTSCTQQSQCVGGYYCNGQNECVPEKANGTACGGNFECLSKQCVDGVCCGTACNDQCERCDATPGTCTTAAAGTDPDSECAPYLCSGAAACSTTCAVNADCATGYYCDGSNACVPLKADGTTCGAAAECQSGNCVDGVCCNSACTGECKRCDLTGSVGQCSNSTAQTDPDNECGKYYCDGSGACRTSCANNNHCKPSFTCGGNNQCN